MNLGTVLMWCHATIIPLLNDKLMLLILFTITSHNLKLLGHFLDYVYLFTCEVTIMPPLLTSIVGASQSHIHRNFFLASPIRTLGLFLFLCQTFTGRHVLGKKKKLSCCKYLYFLIKFHLFNVYFSININFLISKVIWKSPNQGLTLILPKQFHFPHKNGLHPTRKDCLFY